jgi:hypothetical protein
MMVLRMTLRVLSIAIFGGLVSCSGEHRVLVLDQPTELLQRPSPMNYPSTAPLPNTVIRALQPQTVTILSDSYAKDFHVYKVRDSMGNEGYIVDRPGMREKHE